MPFKEKLEIRDKFGYFQPFFAACASVFSGIGRQKYGAYSYETGASGEAGEPEGCLEAYTRHFTLMMTGESMDEEQPHLYCMAARALMLNTGWYRQCLGLPHNERQDFIEADEMFYSMVCGDLDKRTMGPLMEAVWLPPEAFIMMMKLPHPYLVAHFAREKPVKRQCRRETVLRVLDRISGWICLMHAKKTLTRAREGGADVYNDTTLPDFLLYETALLAALLAEDGRPFASYFPECPANPRDMADLKRFCGEDICE
jgi:hypothetical protein